MPIMPLCGLKFARLWPLSLSNILCNGWRIIGRLSEFVAFAGAILLLAPGGASGQQVNLYVPDFGSNPPVLSEYSISPTTGVLTPLPGQATSSADVNSTRVAMTPDNRFLYVPSHSGVLDAYTVGVGGQPRSPSGAALTSSPAGRWASR